MNVIAIVVTAILGILALFFGIYLVKFKAFFKELAELVVVINNSLKDNKVTTKELERIVKEAKDVMDVWKKK